MRLGHDLKQYGKEPSMPRPLINLSMGLVALIAVLLAYGLVADVSDRVVVMSRAEFEREIQQQRIQAAKETMEARECVGNWRDLFHNEPRKLGAM
jgi:hypothetical protein